MHTFIVLQYSENYFCFVAKYHYFNENVNNCYHDSLFQRVVTTKYFSKLVDTSLVSDFIKGFIQNLKLSHKLNIIQ